MPFGFSLSIRARMYSGVVVGPIFTPSGFDSEARNSTCAPSSCRVRSPTQSRWPDTSYGSSVRESIRVRACSYSRMSASCDA